jgi:outer membrane lipoprotein-sorting protein
MKSFSISCLRRRFASIILVLAGPAVIIGFGQTLPDLKTIFEGVSRAYENQQQFDVTGAATTEEYSIKGKATLKAKFRIASQDPNKFRLEQESSIEMDGGPSDTLFGPIVIVADGTDVWGISPAVDEYTKFRPNDLPTVQAWVKAAQTAVFAPAGMLGKEIANSGPIREELIAIGGTNVDCFVIKLISPDRPESTTLWVEKARFLVRRIRSELEPSVGPSTTTEFLVLNIGVPPPESTFVFSPSPSAKEVDKLKP